MDSKADPLDPETIRQLRTLGDDAFINELAEMFLTDFDPAYDKLLKSIANEDHVTASATAHFLKGSSSSIGLRMLAAVLADIEHHFSDGSVPLNETTMSELDERAEEARSRLRVFLAESEESATTGR